MRPDTEEDLKPLKICGTRGKLFPKVMLEETSLAESGQKCAGYLCLIMWSSDKLGLLYDF
jgi:hypothetical protein